MAKKLKLTVSEALVYVETHSSWLNSKQRHWHLKLVEFHSANGFLSPKQQAMLGRWVLKIRQNLNHNAAAASTMRVSYQKGHE